MFKKFTINSKYFFDDYTDVVERTNSLALPYKLVNAPVLDLVSENKKEYWVRVKAEYQTSGFFDTDIISFQSANHQIIISCNTNSLNWVIKTDDKICSEPFVLNTKNLDIIIHIKSGTDGVFVIKQAGDDSPVVSLSGNYLADESITKLLICDPYTNYRYDFRMIIISDSKIDFNDKIVKIKPTITTDWILKDDSSYETDNINKKIMLAVPENIDELKGYNIDCLQAIFNVAGGGDVTGLTVQANEISKKIGLTTEKQTVFTAIDKEKIVITSEGS